MATRMQRVDDALQQLLFRLVPSNPDEDEAVEDQRYDEALQFARNTIGRHDPSVWHLQTCDAYHEDPELTCVIQSRR